MTTLMIMFVDGGFCRIAYEAKSQNGETGYYALQDDGGEVNLYSLTDEYEPLCKVTVKGKIKMQVPKGGSELEELARVFILNHSNIEEV